MAVLRVEMGAGVAGGVNVASSMIRFQSVTSSANPIPQLMSRRTDKPIVFALFSSFDMGDSPFLRLSS
jgi:hypothetical protein